MFRTTLIAAAFVTFGMPALAADCANWNKLTFFQTASFDKVTACIAAGADINVKGQGRVDPVVLGGDVVQQKSCCN
jgi:hypothetical protein